VAFGLRGEGLHDVDDDETADDRREKHQIAEAARTFAQIRIEDEAQPAVVKQVVHQRYQGAKRDGAKTRHHANRQGKPAKCQQANPSFFASGFRAGGDEYGLTLGRNCGRHSDSPSKKKGFK
jgi:hypothetical protein